MTLLQALVLGTVQGLTEFLPVSSDGHLALTYRMFGSSPDLSFEVFLHLATLVAMIVHFRTDLLELVRSVGPSGKGTPQRRLLVLLIIGTGVSGVLALAAKRLVEAANESLLAIGAGFLVTAAVLAASELLARRAPAREAADLGWKRTVGVAVAQAAAALPGVSRSGLTIAGGMVAGLSREQAARFSFLLGIPIIAAANLFEARDLLDPAVRAAAPEWWVAAAGFVAAGVSGYAAISALLAFVRTRPLYAFSVYTAVVGLVTIALGFFA